MTTLRRSNAVIKRNSKTPIRMSRSILVGGAEHILPYGSISQYNTDGTRASACRLAALNFARIAFSMEKDGLQNTALLQAVMARECAEEATSIHGLWSGNVHLEVEDICHIPLFEETLNLKTTTYGLPRVTEFESLLTELSNLASSAVTIITHALEVIACLKLRLKIRPATRNVFIIFDPYPHSHYPDGTGMIASTSIEGTASRLTELLRIVHLTENFPQQQVTNYIGHVFVPHDVKASTPTMSYAVFEPDLPRSPMQAEISQNEFLKSEQQRPESEIKETEMENRRQKTRIQQEKRQLGSSSGPSKYFGQPSAPSRRFSSSMRHSSHPSSSIASTSTIPFGRDSPSARSIPIRALPPIPISDREDSLDSVLYAMRLENEFDNEDRALSAQRAKLAKFPQRLFTCGICLEEMPDDSIALPDPCRHTFCRECLYEYVTTRLNERRFPILCPTCTANNGRGEGVAGEISQSLALNLGLNDEQFSIWIEMEMAPFSILLNCRKCQRTMFVARDEHEEVNIITCPLPDCNHAWCKQCQQSIDFNGPEHSCDGTLELEFLMSQQGWKYCPICKTPIQKISGCNHMTCRTPGCNTHFCYQCGGLMAHPQVIEAPTAAEIIVRMNCQCMW